MKSMLDISPGSLKGEELELTNFKDPQNGEITVDFSKDTKSILNDIRLAINSGADPIKLNVVLESENNLFKNGVNSLRNEKPVTISQIAKENSQLIEKLKEIKPLFGNRVDIDFLNVSKNEGITNWKDLDRLVGPTEKQLLTGLEARLKNAWENNQVSIKELTALSGNHQNASILTGSKIDKVQKSTESISKEVETPKKENLNTAQTPSQLKNERDQVFSIIKSLNSNPDVKVLNPKPGSHDGFIVGMTDNFVVQRLGSESRFFMVHDKKDLPTATVSLTDKVRVLRNEQGQSKVESLVKQQVQSNSAQLKR